MRRVYSKQAMQAIFMGMGLPQLTITPAWEEGVIGAWPDTHGPIATELPELIGNLHRCKTLLEVGGPCLRPAQAVDNPAGRPAAFLIFLHVHVCRQPDSRRTAAASTLHATNQHTLTSLQLTLDCAATMP